MGPGFFHFAIGELGFILTQLAFFACQFILESSELAVNRGGPFGDLCIARLAGGFGAGFHELRLADIGTGEYLQGLVGARFNRRGAIHPVAEILLQGGHQLGIVKRRVNGPEPG